MVVGENANRREYTDRAAPGRLLPPARKPHFDIWGEISGLERVIHQSLSAALSK